MTDPALCPDCEKPPALCVCAGIRPQATRLHALILQHPQEPDKLLGSARLANLALPSSTLEVGLSWPNLKAALRESPDIAAAAVPSRWIALYLGSGVQLPQGSPRLKPGLHLVDKRGAPAADPAAKKAAAQGIVALDGTWSQAKALWWRNAWLLKLQRAVLVPREPSLYRELRREPRGECLSTIETIAETLTSLGEPPAVEAELKRIFGEMLDKRRAMLRGGRGAGRGRGGETEN